MMADGNRTDDDAWFRPKRIGWGYTPNRWQGWAIIVAFGAIAIAVDVALRRQHRWLEIAILVVMTIGLVAVAAHHSSGRDDR